MPKTSTHRLRSVIGLITATATATALLAALAPAAGASTPSGTASTSSTLDADLRALVTTGASSALGEVRQDGRTVWRGRAGVADLATGAPVPPDARFRIGSVTKVFVSTVTLQLAGEQRVVLDDPIEHYLPGAVPNGADITVRQLLSHTSGLFNYTEDPIISWPDQAAEQAWLDGGRWKTYTADDLVRVATAHPPYFAPGQGYHYSNTDYLVIGMLIERVTGRSWQDEVERRIIRPLGLHATAMPDTSPDIQGPHTKGYFDLPTGPADVTRFNPSIAGSAGAGISDATDLARFTAALTGGRLLQPAQLAQMEQPSPQSGANRYGLGLVRFDTPCGVFFGHDGGIFGYQNMVVSSADGRRQAVMEFTPYQQENPGIEAAKSALLSAEMCATK